jgi:cytochrome b561
MQKMKGKRRVGLILVVAGLLATLVSGEAVSYFGTMTIASGGGKNGWYQAEMTISPHAAAEWTWTVIAAGVFVSASGIWLLFRQEKTKPDLNAAGS